MSYKTVNVNKAKCDIKDINSQYNSEDDLSFGRILCLIIYLLIPLVGWFFLIISIRYIRQGEFLVITQMDGTNKEYSTTGFNILPGIYPWERKDLIKFQNLSKESEVILGSTNYAYVPPSNYAITNTNAVLGPGFHQLQTSGSNVRISGKVLFTDKFYQSNNMWYSNDSNIIAYTRGKDNKLEPIPCSTFVTLERPIVAILCSKDSINPLSIQDEFSHPSYGKWKAKLNINFKISDHEKLHGLVTDEEKVPFDLNTLSDKLKEILRPIIDQAIQNNISEQVSKDSEASAVEFKADDYEALKTSLEENGIEVQDVFMNIMPTECNAGMQKMIEAFQSGQVADRLAKARSVEAEGEAQALSIKADAEALRAEKLTAAFGGNPVAASNYCAKKGISVLGCGRLGC